MAQTLVGCEVDAELLYCPVLWALYRQLLRQPLCKVTYMAVILAVYPKVLFKALTLLVNILYTFIHPFALTTP